MAVRTTGKADFIVRLVTARTTGGTDFIVTVVTVHITGGTVNSIIRLVPVFL